MGSALELRAPYLDQAVMEFAASLPVAERVRGVTTKVFLKRFALRYLPSQDRVAPEARAFGSRSRAGCAGRSMTGPCRGWATVDSAWRESIPTPRSACWKSTGTVRGTTRGALDAHRPGRVGRVGIPPRHRARDREVTHSRDRQGRAQAGRLAPRWNGSGGPPGAAPGTAGVAGRPSPPYRAMRRPGAIDSITLLAVPARSAEPSGRAPWPSSG